MYKSDLPAVLVLIILLFAGVIIVLIGIAIPDTPSELEVKAQYVFYQSASAVEFMYRCQSELEQSFEWCRDFYP